jgi:hypothetical protein
MSTEYDFIIIYRKASHNQKADIVSRCPVYTFREGGPTVILEKATSANVIMSLGASGSI